MVPVLLDHVEERVDKINLGQSAFKVAAQQLNPTEESGGTKLNEPIGVRVIKQWNSSKKYCTSIGNSGSISNVLDTRRIVDHGKRGTDSIGLGNSCERYRGKTPSLSLLRRKSH